MSQDHSEMIGKRFGRFVVIAPAPPSEKGGFKRWKCRCDCGVVKEAVFQHNLRNGASHSCGCFSVDRARKSEWNVRHGMRNSREYSVWKAMISRCENPNATGYSRYGGSGISVCKRWRESFEMFFKDMGERPEWASIDRIDNNGNYEPGNCRWATRKQQSSNRKTTTLITYDGKTMCASEWDRFRGFNLGIVSARIASGWSVEDAISKPIKRAIKNGV